MGIGSYTEIKFIFKDENFEDAKNWFKKLNSSELFMSDYSDYLKGLELNQNYIDKDFHKIYEVVLKMHNRNFWIERYGLICALNNITDYKIINQMKDYWYESFSEINKQYHCAIEYFTYNEWLDEERIVYDFNGKEILHEENHREIDENDYENDKVVNSNPDFRRTKVEDLILGLLSNN